MGTVGGTPLFSGGGGGVVCMCLCNTCNSVQCSLI